MHGDGVMGLNVLAVPAVQQKNSQATPTHRLESYHGTTYMSQVACLHDRTDTGKGSQGCMASCITCWRLRWNTLRPCTCNAEIHKHIHACTYADILAHDALYP